jgi:hypothetical protein
MKKHLLLFAGLAIAVASQAQITVTQADYGQAGDSIVVGYDDAPPTGLNVGGTGSQTWDFSTLSLSNINTLNFVDPSNTASGSHFPDADLAIERQADTLFFQSSSSAFVIDGVAGAGFGFPISIIADFEPNSTQIEFPSTNGANFMDTAVFDTIVSCAEFGFGSTCDSARLKRVLVGTSVINAYGTISTPGGTFEALRQYFREDNRDTVWIKVPFFGWTQFLDSASTEYNYRWIANGEKWPVLSARADAVGGDIVSAEFVIGAQVLGYANAENDPSCHGGCDGYASVFAVGGVPPYTYAWPGGQTTAAVGNLCAGTYVVTISDNDTGSYEVTVQLNDPSPLNVSGAVQGASIGGDGAIDINVSGGAGGFSYAWTGPDGFTAATQDIGNLEVGDYTVVVTDANDCDTSKTFTVALTGLSALSDGGLKVYPNPVSSQLTILAGNQIQHYRLSDLLGNVVLQGQQAAYRIDLNAEALSAGVYLLEVSTLRGNFVQKITVQH